MPRAIWLPLFLVGIFLPQTAAQRPQTTHDAELKTVLELFMKGELAKAGELAGRVSQDVCNDFRWWQNLAGNLTIASHDGYEKQRPWSRGAAAEALGLHATALENYRKALALVENESSARHLHQAIADSHLRLEDLEGCRKALQSLEKMCGEPSERWQLENVRKDLRLLDTLSKAPRDAAVRMRYAQARWLSFGREEGYADAAGFLKRTLRFGCHPIAARVILAVSARLWLQLESPGRASACFDELVLFHPGAEESDHVAIMIANFSLTSTPLRPARPADARAWAKRVTTAPVTSRWLPSAHLLLAQTAEAEGDQKTMGRELELVLQSAGERRLMRYEEAAPVEAARKRLGQYYRATGDFDRALVCFEKLQNLSTCGIGHAEHHEERTYFIAECLAAAGRAGEAFRDYIEPFMTSDIGSCTVGGSARMARLAVAIHEKDGRLNDLLAAIEDLANADARYTARLAYDMAKIRLFAKSRDQKAIVRAMLDAAADRQGLHDHPGGDPRRAAVAVEALLEIPGAGFADLVIAHDELMKSPPAHGDDAGRSKLRWIYWAIRSAPTAEARAWLAVREAAARGTNAPRAADQDLLFVLDTFGKPK